MAQTIYNIRPGNTITFNNFGHPTTIHARKVFEHDSTVYVTDDTGYTWPLYPEDHIHIH